MEQTLRLKDSYRKTMPRLFAGAMAMWISRQEIFNPTAKEIYENNGIVDASVSRPSAYG